MLYLGKGCVVHGKLTRNALPTHELKFLGFNCPQELSNGPASDLTRLTQEEIMSLRLQLVAKIRE